MQVSNSSSNSPCKFKILTAARNEPERTGTPFRLDKSSFRFIDSPARTNYALNFFRSDVMLSSECSDCLAFRFVQLSFSSTGHNLAGSMEEASAVVVKVGQAITDLIAISCAGLRRCGMKIYPAW